MKDELSELGAEVERLRAALGASQRECRELRTSKQLILSAAGQGILGLNGRKEIIFANAAAFEILRIERSAIGQRVCGPICPLGRATEHCPFSRALAQGESVRAGDTIMHRLDGTAFPAEYVISPIMDEDRATGAVCVFSDLTDARRTSEALEQSEQRYRRLFERMSQGVVYWDEEGRLLAANPAAERILGLSLEQMESLQHSGGAWEAVQEDGSPFPPEMRPSRIALRTGVAVRDVVMGVRNAPSEDFRWMLIDSVPEFASGDTKPNQVFTTLRDITAQKRATDQLTRVAAELAQSNAALRTMNRLYSLLSQVNQTLIRAKTVQGLLDGICSTAVEDGGFQLAWFGVVDRPSAEVHAAAMCGPALGYLKSIRVRADDSPQGCGPVGRALQSGEIVICNDIDGAGFMQPWWTEARRFGLRSIAAIPVKLSGSVFGAFAIYAAESGFFSRREVELLKEISGDVSFGLEKMESERQREAAGKTLQDTIDHLSRSNAELENFAYVASHDLQEPLRMVISYLQLLKRRYAGTLGTEGEEFLGYAVQGGLRMKVLVDDLLKYSRLDSSAKAFSLEEAGALVNHALANLQVAIEESGALVTSDGLPGVFVDPGQMIQVFQNLIGNSLKFRGSEQPRIQICARLDAKLWIFSVSDNGIGVDPRYRERIFEIFRRLHPQSDYPGSGIGLTICKRIVERHGGRIWLEPREGPGATFCFSLPAENR